MEQYFSILGLPYSASTEEVKISYKQLIKQWHPDRFPDNSAEQVIATEKCKGINNAYDFLKKYYKSNKPELDKKQSEDCIWIKVKSSNIHSVGYNESTNTLRVIFLNGGRYEYEKVPKTIYSQLMSASSKGSYANRYIFYNYKYKVF